MLILAELEPAQFASATEANMNGAVDAAYHDKPLRDVAAAPPSALQGLAGWTDETLTAFGVETVADLGKFKWFVIAEAIATLADVEEDH